MIRRRLLFAAAVAAVLASAPASPAGAQTFPSVLTAQSALSGQCVGGSLFCTQMDFSLMLSAGSTTLDYFTLELTSPGWEFLNPNQSEARDSEGMDPFVVPDVQTPQQLVADFFFGAVVNDLVPLTMRFELVSADDDISTLALRYSGGSQEDPNAVFGTFGSAVVPEPHSLALLATGLAALVYLRRRPRSRRRV